MYPHDVFTKEEVEHLHRATDSLQSLVYSHMQRTAQLPSRVRVATGLCTTELTFDDPAARKADLVAGFICAFCKYPIVHIRQSATVQSDTGPTHVSFHFYYCANKLCAFHQGSTVFSAELPHFVVPENNVWPTP